jgi:hypothetical protein
MIGYSAFVYSRCKGRLRPNPIKERSRRQDFRSAAEDRKAASRRGVRPRLGLPIAMAMMLFTLATSNRGAENLYE